MCLIDETFLLQFLTLDLIEIFGGAYSPVSTPFLPGSEKKGEVTGKKVL